VTTVLVGGREPLTGRLAAALAPGGRCAVWDGPSGAPLESWLRDTGPAAAVYLAVARGGRLGPPDAPDAAACLAACLAAGARRCVLVSSTEVIRPHPHHPGFTAERAAVAARGANAVADAWRDLERRAARAAGREALLVLRAAPVVVRGGRGYWSRLFGGRWAVVYPGRDPSLQLLAVEDLAAAVARALAVERAGSPGGPHRTDAGPAGSPHRSDAGTAGVYQIVPRAVVPLRRGLRLAGARPVPVPRSLQRLLRPLLGGRAAPLDQVDYLRHHWTASGAAARRDLGFTAAAGSVEAAAAARRAPGAGAPAPAGEAADPDAFGMDRAYVDRHGRGLIGFLHDVYWRVDLRGSEHLPRAGAAVLVGVHRGFMPWDGVMALHGLARSTGRYVRFLLHPCLLRFPFLFDFMIKLGGVPASRANAERLLRHGEIVGVFPEGIRGAFTPYREAYRIGPAWRDDFAALALRHRVPIVPLVTVGSAEIYPILGRLDWRWWRRISEWPYVPVTPTFPLVPLPLPSKWHSRVLPPILPGAGGDDPAAVAALGRQVRDLMQAALSDLRARRRSIFVGALRPPPGGEGPAGPPG
jgi:1-acyl-sn-glycerol-3-phosphate acyltransferase/nucleoside-diphosphate-sugar epimerase